MRPISKRLIKSERGETAIATVSPPKADDTKIDPTPRRAGRLYLRN
jgi:hypothetical protein